MQDATSFPDRVEGADDTVRRAARASSQLAGFGRRDEQASLANPFAAQSDRSSGSPGPRLGDQGFRDRSLPPDPAAWRGYEPPGNSLTGAGLAGGGLASGGLTGGGLSGGLADLDAVLAPSSRQRARADVLSPATRRADAFVDAAFDAAALNPLVSAASPLLWLAARLNESAAPEDVRTFRESILDEIRRFEAAAMTRGVPNRSVLVARYALCATIDDVILNTSWAGHAQWATGSLVGLLYGETWGGERFFEILRQLVTVPDENIDVLELQAVCLAIGFVGKYRVMEDGQNLLTRLRAELYRIIRQVRGSYERDLAPPWQGVSVPYRAPPSALRFWIPVLCALPLLAAFYVGLRLSLASRVDIGMQRIAALVPATPVAIAKPDIPPIPKKPVPLTQVQRISAVLQREIAERRVEVVGSPTTVAVRLPASTFPSAGTTLPASDAPLIERIAASLNHEPGPITVTGYTDNVPIAPVEGIKSNLDLSKARATSVADMLKPYLTTPSRVGTAGRGEDDPIASNTTPEGRARNRRVEIQIPAEETLAGSGRAPAQASTAPAQTSTAPAPAGSASPPPGPSARQP